jgi:hypothetical protein
VQHSGVVHSLKTGSSIPVSFPLVSFVVLCILMLLPCPAQSTEFYVDCSVTNGTGGSGSVDDPFESVADIMAHESTTGFADGDDIYFLDGSHCDAGNSALDVTWSGVDAANPSTIGCYSPEGAFDCDTKPIISRSLSTGGSKAVSLEVVSHIVIQDLDIRNTSSDWEDNGNTGIGTPYPGGNEYRGNITIQRCNFRRWGHYALGLLKIGGNTIVVDNTFEENGNCVYIADESSGTSDHFYIARNTCVDTVGYEPSGGGGKVDGHCVGFQRASYSLIENNVSFDAHGGAYVVWCGTCTSSHDVIVRNNRSYGTYGPGLVLTGPLSVDNAYGYIVYRNVFTRTSEGSQRESIRVTNANMTSRGFRVFHNTVFDGRQGGFCLKASVANVVDSVFFHNNIVVLDSAGEPTDLFSRMEEKSNASDPDGVIGDNNHFDFNLYWAVDGDPSDATRWMDTDLASYDFGGWQSRGRDVHGRAGNPSFSAPAGNDFSVLAGSPAIDNGGFLSHVSYDGIGSSSGSSVVVADSYWFHGNLGLKDDRGLTVTGMPVSFYDTVNGRQDREVTSVDYSTHTLFLNASVSYIHDSANPTDSSRNTQVSLHFEGLAPDIGAMESGGSEPQDGQGTDAGLLDGGDFLDGDRSTDVDAGGDTGSDAGDDAEPDSGPDHDGVSGGCSCGMPGSEVSWSGLAFVAALVLVRPRRSRAPHPDRRT